MLDEEEINEPIIDQQVNANENHHEIEDLSFLKEYSHFGKNHEREQDIEKVNSYTKMRRNNIILTKAPNFMITK